jgi:hypothetical protein
MMVAALLYRDSPPRARRHHGHRDQGGDGMSSILSVSILYERDIVLARQRARQIAAALHFDGQDQTRIATAVSEIARKRLRLRQGRAGAVLRRGATGWSSDSSWS